MVHQNIRIGVVTEGFAHLTTVVACQSTGGNDIFIGIFVAVFGLFTEGTDFGKGGINSVDIVEPSTDLADIFYDKIGGVVTLEFFLVFKGIMELCKRHGAGFKPAV